MFLPVETALRASLGENSVGPLTLAEEGSFFVNFATVCSGYPGASLNTGTPPAGRMTINQMYVHYRIPVAPSRPPIVMVHGSNHTGMTYETTPDGREGWATWFTRKGHPVYVVDHPGRGRSGFNPTPINAVRDGGADPKSLPTLFLGTLERSWVNFRFGPEYPTSFPNVQFPLQALDQYLAQLVPNAETTLAGGGINTVTALVALVDKIGPAVIVVHSQSGAYGLDVMRKRPNLVRALISIEGSLESVSADDMEGHLATVPLISVWGDNSEGASGVNGDRRRNGCAQAVRLVQAAGGRWTFFLLPEAGIVGNSHMMMMDKNNLQVASMLSHWIDRHIK